MSKFNYKDPQTLNSVAEFHQTFQHIINDTPTLPDEDVQALRYNLIREELEEFKEACQRGDIVGVADALADLQYVLTGTILSFGFGDKFRHVFSEVQRSNMSKACLTESEAFNTSHKHFTRTGEQCAIRQINGLWIVERLTDRKTIKAINYSPAELQRIINRVEVKPGQVWLRWIGGGELERTLSEAIYIKEVDVDTDGIIGDTVYIDESGWQRDGLAERIHEHFTYYAPGTDLEDGDARTRIEKLVSMVNSKQEQPGTIAD